MKWGFIILFSILSYTFDFPTGESVVGPFEFYPLNYTFWSALGHKNSKERGHESPGTKGLRAQLWLWYVAGATTLPPYRFQSQTVFLDLRYEKYGIHLK